ncbi:MAG: hypothetical protein ACTSQV_03645 [Alphaproteobacteria bacterium]
MSGASAPRPWCWYQKTPPPEPVNLPAVLRMSCGRIWLRARFQLVTGC